jgi:hypothetical protein
MAGAPQTIGDLLAHVVVAWRHSTTLFGHYSRLFDYGVIFD